MSRVDYVRLRAELLARADELVARWLPGGQLVKGEWIVGDVRGSAGDSLKVSIGKGLWHDWAAAKDTPEAGGDLIHLRALQLGVPDHQAAVELWRELGLDGQDPRPSPPPEKPAPRGADQPEPELVCPVPDDAPSWLWILNHRELGQASRHWVYRGTAGGVLMIKVRWDLPDGSKTFRPYSLWNVGGQLKWMSKGIPAPRPLYGLHRLAARPGAPVVICEGEKAADAAGELLPQWVAVCSENGANNAGHADWSPLAGRRVVIWPDNDAPGLAFAAEVQGLVPGARTLDLAALVDRLGLAPLREGDDAADLELDEADRAELHALCNATAGAFTRPAPPPAPAPMPERPRGHAGNPYAAMLEALVAHIDRLQLRPDAVAGWRRTDTGVRSVCGDTEIAQEFAHDYCMAGNKLVDAQLKLAFSCQTRRWRAERRAAIIGRVTGTPASEAGVLELRKWLRALTGKDIDIGTDQDKQTATLNLAVMMHWMWMVKRSAVNLPVDWHLMPILKSTGHGTGKTTAVELLTACFEELSFPIDASAITDERKSLIVTTCLIGRWDEMAGSQKADQEALKRAITEKVHAFRELYTMATHLRQRSCSFIGTANLPVEVLVQDTTGARRFYELGCVHCDFDLMNSVDALLAWQCVDERDDEAPILAHRAALENHQAGIRHQDLVSLWLSSDNHREPRVIYRADQKEPQVVPLYQEGLGYRLDQWAARFRSWCVGVGQVLPPLPRFNLRLQQEGFQHRRVYVEAGKLASREWRYLLPSAPAWEREPPPPPAAAATEPPPVDGDPW